MDEKYLCRTCFLSLFAYMYGEPDDIGRTFKTSLIQFTDAELPLDFDRSIGEQLKSFGNVKPGFNMNEYYNKLIAIAANDDFYNTLFLEYNIQNKLGGECYIFRRDNERYIVFRGSDTPIDIWIDITIESVPLIVGNVLVDETVRVHRGFLEQMKNYNFISQIAKAIQPENDMQIFVIGHSLGSASALIQGYYLHHALKSLDVSISIVSVGGPVVGTSTWVKSFNDIFCSKGKKRRFTRLINEIDIIPNLHTLILNGLDAVPLVKVITSKLDPPPPFVIPNLCIERYLNKYTFEYAHVGYVTYVITKDTFELFGDTWIAEEPRLVRVKNRKHTFHTPNLGEVVDIANNHMIDYQKWMSSHT